MSRLSRAVQAFFSPPIFADEGQTLEARKIWIILWGMIGLMVFQLPILLVTLGGFNDRITIATVGFIIAALGMLILVRKGYSRFASILLTGIALGLLTFAIWRSGGVRAPGMTGLLLVVAISGLLLGARAGRLVAGVVAVCSLFLAVAEMRGWLPPPTTIHNPLSTWIVYIMYLALLVLVQSVFAWVIDRSEAARQASEAIRHRLFESSRIPIVVMDATTFQFVDCNDAAVKLYQVSSRADVLGKTPMEISPSAQYDGTYSIQKFRHYLDRVLSEGSLSFEWRHQRPNGEFWDAEISLMLFRSGQRQLLQCTLQDITERKRVSAEREKLQSQLIQSQKMEAVGRLAGGIAHDYNNILTSTMMQLEFLQSESDVSDEFRSIIKDLETDATRAANLTRQLLLFGRRQVMQQQILDLNFQLDDLLSMLRRLIGEHFSIKCDLAPGSLWLKADPGMLEQVVMNLVVNARDAMPRGGVITISSWKVSFEASVEPHAPEAYPGRFVCLTVADTGTGMNEETRGHIFEPFFTTKESVKGTGLGLATVYGIVKQHHGWIEVDTTPGQGTTFRIYLPEAIKPVESTSENPHVEQVLIGTETLLLVEDEQSVRRSVAGALRHSGYQVIEAENGTDAVAAWESIRDQVDLLITDGVMPGGMSGPELVKRFQKEQPGLKAIIMSGYSPEIANGGVPETWSTRFLQKPFKLMALARLVRECLDQSQTGARRPNGE